jgi:hypothetical protein
MSTIADFDDAERWIVESRLRQRYGRIVATQPAEVELMLSPADASPTVRPTLYWEERGAAFVIAKAGAERWRAMFFYPAEPMGEQYGAGRAEFSDLEECVVALLRAQADHEKQRRGVASGDTAHDLAGAPDE